MPDDDKPNPTNLGWPSRGLVMYPAGQARSASNDLEVLLQHVSPYGARCIDIETLTDVFVTSKPRCYTTG